MLSSFHKPANPSGLTVALRWRLALLAASAPRHGFGDAGAMAAERLERRCLVRFGANLRSLRNGNVQRDSPMSMGNLIQFSLWGISMAFPMGFPCKRMTLPHREELLGHGFGKNVAGARARYFIFSLRNGC